jgi:hypothetical protein
MCLPLCAQWQRRAATGPEPTVLNTDLRALCVQLLWTFVVGLLGGMRGRQGNPASAGMQYVQLCAPPQAVETTTPSGRSVFYPAVPHHDSTVSPMISMAPPGRFGSEAASAPGAMAVV